MIRRILSITLPLTCFYAWSNTDCKSIDQVSWIVGEWQQVNSKKSSTKISHENWQKVSNSTLEGQGFTLDEKDIVVFQESLRIVEMQDQLFFLAKVNGNDLPVAFKATKCSGNSIQFENPKHDFPQRLIYTRGKNSLKVEVSDEQGKGFTMAFTQVQVENRTGR